MEPVSMNDGLEGRETIAFGLAAGEVGVLVLTLLAAYATLRSGLPGAVGWGLAVVLVTAGVALAWGRWAGRPLVEWAVLLARFAVRARRRPAVWRRASPAVWRRAEAGAVVVRMPLRAEATAHAPPPPPPLPRVVCLYSQAGGSGRTTLAVELAVRLAVRGRAAATAGSPGSTVALVDLCVRNPTAAMRLGIRPRAEQPVRHPTGLLALSADPGALEGNDAVAVSTMLAAAASAGAGLVVADVDCDGGARCLALLRCCDEVHVVVTPTVRGVLDAYRSTAALRRLGLREQLGYIGNRWHEGADVAEAMADLASGIAVTVPEDAAFAVAEDTHRPVALGGGGAAHQGIDRLADLIQAPAAARPRVHEAGGRTG